MGKLLVKGHIAPKTKTGTSVISKSTRKSRIFVYNMSAASERLRQAESSYKVPVDKAFCIMGHQHDSDSAGSYCAENQNRHKCNLKSTRKSRIFVYDMNTVSERLRQAESSYKASVYMAFVLLTISTTPIRKIHIAPKMQAF